MEPADTLTPSSYATRPSAIDTGQNQHVERPSAAYPTASPPSPPSLIITNGGVYHPVQAAVSRNAHSLTSAPETQSREAAEEGATPQTRRRRRLYEPHASLDEPLSSARTAALPSRTQIPVPARVRSTRVPLPRDSSVAPSSSTAGSALHRPTAASLARREAAKLEAATRLHEVSSSTAWWERTSSSGWRHAAPIGGSSPNRSPQRASQPGHANSLKTRHELAGWSFLGDGFACKERATFHQPPTQFRLGRGIAQAALKVIAVIAGAPFLVSTQLRPQHSFRERHHLPHAQRTL